MYFIGLILILNLSYEIQGLYYFMEMVEIETLNPEWFDAEATDISIDFINDTFTGLDINLTAIKDLPEETLGHFNLYYKSMDEYSVSSGIDFLMPLCDWLTDKVMMGGFFNALGITAENCPPKAGYYGTRSWYPPRQRMPRMMPAVDYKVMYGMAIDDEYIIKISVYVEITDSSE